VTFIKDIFYSPINNFYNDKTDLDKEVFRELPYDVVAKIFTFTPAKVSYSTIMGKKIAPIHEETKEQKFSAKILYKKTSDHLNELLENNPLNENLKKRFPPPFQLTSPFQRQHLLTIDRRNFQLLTVFNPPRHRLFSINFFRPSAVSMEGMVEISKGIMASICDDRTIRIWDSKTNKELMKLEGHKGGIHSMIKLSDGTLASASHDKTIRIWDPKTGKELKKLEGHEESVFNLTELSDGSIASKSYDRTIRIWDPKMGKELQKIEGIEHCFSRIIIELSDGSIASQSENGIRRWDPKTGEELQKIGNGYSNFDFIKLSNSTIATPSRKSIIIRDPKTGKEVMKFEGHEYDGDVRKMIELSDGSIASVSHNTIWIWDPKTGKELKKFDAYSWDCSTLTELSNGRIACASYNKTKGMFGFESWNRTICILDPKTGQEVAKLELPKREWNKYNIEKLYRWDIDKIHRLMELSNGNIACHRKTLGSEGRVQIFESLPPFWSLLKLF